MHLSLSIAVVALLAKHVNCDRSWQVIAGNKFEAWQKSDELIEADLDNDHQKLNDMFLDWAYVHGKTYSSQSEVSCCATFYVVLAYRSRHVLRWCCIQSQLRTLTFAAYCLVVDFVFVIEKTVIRHVPGCTYVCNYLVDGEMELVGQHLVFLLAGS